MEGGLAMDGNQEDIRLMEKIKQGSQSSFELFYEKYIRFTFHIALQIVGDRTEAEDICHDVFLEVLQKSSQYKPEKGSVKAWLAVKTKSRSLDRLRKKKPLLIHKLESLDTEEEHPLDLLFIHEMERHLIIDALNHIPEKQREAIYRSYFQGETHQEIAKEMNKPLGSVKSFIRYGLKNLRKQKPLVKWVEPERGWKQQ